MLATYVYWISTVLLCLLYLLSAYLYVFRRKWARQGLVDLGYPEYLAWFLLVTKILAVTTIVSRVSILLSDLAYAGMLYHLVLSGLAYVGVRKPKDALPAVVGLLLLTASFATQNAVHDPSSPYALTEARP